jgi:CheY-like chemotaxis protein
MNKQVKKYKVMLNLFQHLKWQVPKPLITIWAGRFGIRSGARELHSNNFKNSTKLNSFSNNAQQMYKFKTIIIIDDNEIDIIINKKVIEHLNITGNIQTFSNPIQVLEYLKFFQRNESYFNVIAPVLILIDNKMPIMTGFEFLDEFNGLTFFEQKQIDILMVSSDYPTQIEKAINKKCCGYIEKPLTSMKLLNQLENINGKK